MLRCLKEDKLINDGNPDIKIKFGEKDFLEAVDLISKDIIKKYGDKLDKVGLIGLARGGLPLLVAVSHRTGIRKVNVVQIQMTNSNEKWDYGDAKWVNGYIDSDIEEFIVFEDIICKGRSVGLLINELLKQGKKIIGVYSLFINQIFKDIVSENEDMDIVYTNMICPKQWVYFFWEKGYLGD